MVILTGLVLKTKLTPTGRILTIANKTTVSVTLADTDQKRTMGYSNHPEIGFNEGLLFVFDRPGRYPFWMKDMLFDLDFIFINNNRVVYLLKNIKAPVNNQGEIEYALSKVPFNQLLEVKAGFIDKHQVLLKDTIILK